MEIPHVLVVFECCRGHVGVRHLWGETSAWQVLHTRQSLWRWQAAGAEGSVGRWGVDQATTYCTIGWGLRLWLRLWNVQQSGVLNLPAPSAGGWTACVRWLPDDTETLLLLLLLLPLLPLPLGFLFLVWMPSFFIDGGLFTYWYWKRVNEQPLVVVVGSSSSWQ